MSLFRVTIFRFVIATTLLLAFLAVGCSGVDKPQATPEPDAQLSEDKEMRVLRLAEAFSRFGEFDIQSGASIASLERIIYCMYTTHLEESHVVGYGQITVEEADATLNGVFGNFEFADILRTQFDSREEQDYFYLDGYYYVKLTDPSSYSYEIVGHTESEEGEIYTVDVFLDGNTESRLVLSLLPADLEADIYRVIKCEILMWK